MSDKTNLTREEQMAEWRKRQKVKSRENLKTLGPRLQEAFLKMRLRYWGAFLVIAGLMTMAANGGFVLRGERDAFVCIATAWGAVLAVIGVLDSIFVSLPMLMMTGAAAILQGALLLVSGNVILGPLLLVAGGLILKDAIKAKQQKGAKGDADRGDGQGKD